MSNDRIVVVGGNHATIPTDAINIPLTVGKSGTGYDVKFFGDTAGSYMLWDADTNSLTLVNATLAYTGTFSEAYGTLAVPVVLTAGSPLFAVYATNAGTSGSTNAEAVLFNTVMTGAGQVGGRVKINMETNVLLGGWANAFKAAVDCKTVGGSTGLLSVACLEMTLPAGSGRGSYTLLELEATAPSSGYDGGQYGSLIYINSSGTTRTEIDDHWMFMHMDSGFTAGAGHMLSAGSQTLKIAFGALQATTRYIVLSDTENSLSFSGAAATPISLSGAFTTGISIAADGTTAISITSAFSGTTGISFAGTATNGISLTGICGSGISITGANTTSSITISGTASRAIMVGNKTTGVTIASGAAVDAEPANNYLVGLFAKVVASEATSTDELRTAWIRTRVNNGCTIGTATGWGYGVCGAEIQLKIYGATVNSWQASAVWAQLETQDATTTFASGCIASCVLANVGLTATTTIASGGVVAGVTINSNTAASGVTATGGFYGLYITQKTAGLLDFTEGIHIDVGCCTTAFAVGSKANTSGSGMAIPSTDDWGAVRIFTDDNGASVGKNVRALQSRTLITVAQAGGSIRAIQGQLRVLDAANFNTGVYAAVQGYIELSGSQTVATAGILACFDASIEIGTALTATGYVAGFKAELTGSGTCAAGLDCGFLVTNAAGAAVWSYGLYIEASATDTGIYVGTCTTGINLASCTTQAIYANVTAVAAAGSLTGSAFCVYAAGQAGQNDVGIVAYLDATAKGLSTGNWTYGAGIWLNIDSTFAHAETAGWGGHEQLCPLSVGVYAPSGVGAGIDDNDIIYGIKAELVGNAVAPTSNGCYFACLNVSQTAAQKTAIFFACQNEAVGYGANKTTQAGSLALICINGTMYYVNLYSA